MLYCPPVFMQMRSGWQYPDGFLGSFFIATWPITGASVVKAVQHFFTFGKLYKASNTYLLTLIPKIPPPISFDDFRPISLLNFSNKILSKFLASRLSKILPSIISPNQAAFVKGRSIHQHIALAHEVFQKLYTKRSGGSLCMQLDISKAFDKLSWAFLLKSLPFFGFSEKWITLIKECISSAKGLVLINRSPCGFSNPTVVLGKGILYPHVYSLLQRKS